MTNAIPDPPESGDQSKPPAAKPKPANGGRWADRYEYQIEFLVSVLLILGGLIVAKMSSGKLGQAVGVSLLSAGCVALIVFLGYGWMFRKRSMERAEAQSQLVNVHVQQAIDAGLAQSLPEFKAAKAIGLTDFTVGRPKRLNDAVLKATERLDILEVSLKTMQSIDASRWRACRAKIRIILLDPLYPGEEVALARQRDIEEKMGDGQILSEIHQILKIFPEEWFAPNESNSANESTLGVPDSDRSGERAGAQLKADEARVKLARAMPTMSYFRFDGHAYFAPLVHTLLGEDAIHLELSQGGEFFLALETHFDTLWNDKKRVVTVRPADIPEHYTSLGSSAEAAS